MIASEGGIKMRISSLNNNLFDYKKNSQNINSNTVSFGENIEKQSSLPANNPVSQAKIYIDELQKLKTEAKKYPLDVEYRKNLLANAGLNPKDYYKIRAIIGGSEIQDIMTEFNEHASYYRAGNNLSNVKKAQTRANLHIHTQASDGFLSVEELLNKAANYANFVAKNNKNAKNEPFVIAITDHDTTESAAKAIKIIAENPVKYKNLRVILGLEMTTFNNIAPEIAKEPTNTHVLAYGIDPNEKLFKNFIDSTKQNKHNIINLMTEDANKTYANVFGKSDFYNAQQAKEFSPPLEKGILGIYNYMQKFFETKFMLNDIALKNKKIVKNLKENNLPTTTDELLNEMKNFYYAQNHNNVIGSPQRTIPEFLSSVTKMEKDDIAKIIQEDLNTSKIKNFTQELSKQTDKYKITFNSQYNYIPNFENLYDSLKNQPNTLIGLAHPLDTVKKIPELDDKFKFLKILYSEFIKHCKDKAKFSEVYYQSYDKLSTELNNYKMTEYFMNMMSNLHKLFKTGSADTHRMNIFKRYL